MYRAKSENIESLPTLLTLLDPIMENKNFLSMLGDECVIKELDYKKPPLKFDNVCDVEISELTLQGELQSIDWKSISYVLDTLDDSIGMTGRISVSIDFEEQESELSNEGKEEVEIIKECGKYYFTFLANGSRISVDHEYAIEVFENMFKVMELPVTLIREGKDYSLKHIDDGYLWVSHSSLFGKNPKLFSCELSNMNKENLIDKLRYFIKQYDHGKIINVTWSVGTSSRFDDESEETSKVVELYNTVVGFNLPALKYSICPSFKLASLKGLGAIRTLCAEKNTMTVRYGVMNFDNVKVLVSVCVSEDGYSIEVGTKDQLAIEKLSSILVLDFEEN